MDDDLTRDSPAALRVLEVSTGIAGAYCGWLLQQLGATVMRAGAAPGAKPDAAGNAVALALGYFNSGKTDTSDAAWPGANIVITDDVPQFERLAQCSLAAFAMAHPDCILGAATSFGLTGPLAGKPATPLDAQAVSGVAWALGEPGRAPLSIPPGLLESQAGAHLAAACLMARLVGGGRVVDVALADVLASYVAVNCRFYIHHGMQWRRAGRRASGSGGSYPFGILPCRDGDVCLSGRTRQEWQRFVEAMGNPEWAARPRYQKLRLMGQDYPGEVDALVLPWLQRHTKAEIEAIANRHQLTIAPLRDFAEVLATPQLRERGFFRDATLAGHAVRGPGLPFRVAEARSAGTGAGLGASMLSATVENQAGTGKPLSGLRVLDLGWVWSAPQVGGILAQFGAEVIKVEHAGRPDNTRLSGPIVKDGRRIEGPATEMSPMFHQINQGKLGITLNMKEPEGLELIKRLAARSDIVIENMSAGAMERTGLGYDVLRGLNPGAIMLAMSGAGQFGPLWDMRTYAPVMSSFAGLESLVGYEGEAPLGALNFALGDPNAAVHALVAVFAALLRRQMTGTGCYIDLSQTEALLATLAPYLLLAQTGGRQPAPTGNAHPAMAPHGIYPASGTDRWLTIAVADDAQWAAFAALSGLAGEAGGNGFDTAAERLAHHADLDRIVAGWTAGQDRDALVARLRQAGIASSPVQSIEEVWADPHFAARAMKHPVELPSWAPRTCSGRPGCSPISHRTTSAAVRCWASTTSR